eukprot:2408469-Rhodomonas_salina.3
MLMGDRHHNHHHHHHNHAFDLSDVRDEESSPFDLVSETLTARGRRSQRRRQPKRLSRRRSWL